MDTCIFFIHDNKQCMLLLDFEPIYILHQQDHLSDKRERMGSWSDIEEKHERKIWTGRWCMSVDVH